MIPLGFVRQLVEAGLIQRVWVYGCRDALSSLIQINVGGGRCEKDTKSSVTTVTADDDGDVMPMPGKTVKSKKPVVTYTSHVRYT